MAGINLTKRLIEQAVYRADGPNRQFLWDSRVRGLAVRLTPAGGKQYTLLYRINGRQRLLSLGPVEHFRSLVEARSKAEELLHALHHEQRDPLDERSRLAEGATLAEAWERYMTEHASQLSEHSRENLRSAWKHVEPALGALRVSQVTKADVIRLHDRVTRDSGPVAANRTVQRLRAVLGWISERDERQFGLAWRNPCTGVRLHREHPREHVLTLDQMRQLLAALEGEDYLWSRSFLALLCLTGARMNEIRFLKWADVDLERAVAVLSHTKNGRSFELPLCAQAVSVLDTIPRIAGNPYIFASPRRPHSAMIEPRTDFKDALKRAGLPTKTTLHDLRRSYATAAAMRGASAEMVSRALNNTSAVTARVYLQLAQDVARRIAEDQGKALLPSSK